MTKCQPVELSGCQAGAFPVFLYLGLLFLSGINDGGAADLGDLAALPVERPAADLIPNDILDEKHPPVEPQGQLVKELNVLQHVVIGVAVGMEAAAGI